MADHFLGADDARRLKKALKRGQPIPDDIVARLEGLGGDDGALPPPSPQSSGSGRKQRPSGQTGGHQGDLFGEDS
jgi:hypothetical protein